MEPAIMEPAIMEPAIMEPAIVEPAIMEPAIVEPAIMEPAIVEPAEAMEATGAKSEAGEPAEGIAVAIIRPVTVIQRATGVFASGGGQATVIRRNGVAGRANRSRLGSARRRSAQHSRGWERG